MEEASLLLPALQEIEEDVGEALCIDQKETFDNPGANIKQCCVMTGGD